jgi:hypothetical protein
MSAVGYHHCRWWELIRDNRPKSQCFSLMERGKARSTPLARDLASHIQSGRMATQVKYTAKRAGVVFLPL